MEAPSIQQQIDSDLANSGSNLELDRAIAIAVNSHTSYYDSLLNFGTLPGPSLGYHLCSQFVAFSEHSAG